VTAHACEYYCTYYVGDALTVMRTLPADYVDLVLSSPAFLGLRSYLPPGHPDKAKEMGSEPTPGEFIDALLDVVEEADRVLAPHGSLVLELGDTYAGSGGGGGDYLPGGMREGQQQFSGSGASMRESNAAHWRQKNAWNSSDEKAYGLGTAPRPARVRRQMGNGRDWPQSPGANWKGERDGWPLDKSLCLIPELLRFALAYGFNPLTGRQTPRWRVRNVVRWCRPNPPVGALADKFRPGTSEMVVACKSRSRYFDLDAVRTPLTEPGAVKRHSTGQHNPGLGWQSNSAEIRQNEAGAPPLDWWEPNEEEVVLWEEWRDQFGEQLWVIPTKGYPGSHYATWPPALCVRPILAMCPERVCTECGEPSRRLTSIEHQPNRTTNGPQSLDRRHAQGGSPGFPVRAERVVQDLGWTDCGHDAWRPGVVLDPFAGTGTTGLVATGHGRSAVLIDLDERNLHLARERIGMFLAEGVVEASA
jgi:site-specific DNA-methyltransferase (adenine-specific)